jgi:hypothetical protein
MVRSSDNAGNYTNWTTTWSVTVNDVAPAPPSALTQLVGAGNNIGLTWSSWTNDTHPRLGFVLSATGGDQVKYNIQITTANGNFSYLVVNTTQPPAGYLAQGTTWYDTTLMQETSYWWQVKCIDDSGLQSVYSSGTLSAGQFDLGIDLTPPTVPTLSGPLNTLTTNQYQLTFSWNGSTDAASGVGNYTIETSTTANMSGLVTSSSTLGTSATLSLTNGVWYWTAMSSDVAGNYSSWASTWSVVIDTLTPSAITTFAAVTGFSPGVINLSWTAPGGDGNITNGAYRIRYSTYVPGSWTDASANWTNFQTKYQVQWSTNTTPGAAQTWVLTGMLQATTYYVQIWECDAMLGSGDWNGNWSGLSNQATSWAQTTILTVDAEPKLVLNFGSIPAGTSAVIPSTFSITNFGNVRVNYNLQLTGVPSCWSVKEASGATGYEQIKVLALFTSANPPAVGSFVDNIATNYAGDIVRASTYDVATSSNFAVVTDNVSVKGYYCTVAVVRSLWFRFDAPSATVNITSQYITVTVTASQD